MLLNLENSFLFMSSSETQNNVIIYIKSREDIRGNLEMVMKLWYKCITQGSNVLFKITSEEFPIVYLKTNSNQVVILIESFPVQYNNNTI